ncbi:LysR substrate-binding domain-containing protein [Agromyces soli]
MIDLRQLRALRAVAALGSVAAAARELGWSQPTVAHHLAGLARATGAPVVASTSTGTALTAAGRLWLPHAAAIVDRADRALAEIERSVDTSQRTVRFGVFPTAAARLLPGLVAAFDVEGLAAEVTEAELDVLEPALDRLELDAAVVYTAPGHEGTGTSRGETASRGSGIARTHLFTERFSLVVPARHPFAGRDRVALRALARDRWILGTDDDDPVDSAFRAASVREGFTPVVGPRSDDYRVIVEYVAAGLGIALVPELALPTGRADVAVLEVDGLGLAREVSLATIPTLDPELRALMVQALR